MEPTNFDTKLTRLNIFQNTKIDETKQTKNFANGLNEHTHGDSKLNPL